MNMELSVVCFFFVFLGLFEMSRQVFEHVVIIIQFGSSSHTIPGGRRKSKLSASKHNFLVFFLFNVIVSNLCQH